MSITLNKLDSLTPHAAKVLAPAVDGWADLADDLREGRAELLMVNGGESYAVTRLERSRHRDELVVCAYAGHDVVAFGRMMREIALASGCRTARWHTMRRGLGRLLKEFGAVEVETVYRIAL